MTTPIITEENKQHWRFRNEPDLEILEIFISKAELDHPVFVTFKNYKNKTAALGAFCLNGTYLTSQFNHNSDLIYCPPKQKVPLTFEDIGDGDLFSQITNRDDKEWIKWTKYLPESKLIYLSGFGWRCFADLQKHWLRSRDHGKTWERCEKEVES